MAPPFAKVEFDIMYGEGISAEGDVLDLGVKFEIVDKSGAWYSINGERMGQGRDAAKVFLKENPKIMSEIRHKIYALKGIALNKLTEDKGEKTTEEAPKVEKKATATAAPAAKRPAPAH